MPFPKTLNELKAANYVFDNYGTCRGCGEDVEWYKTPNGKSIPMNPMTSGDSPATPHWATCTEQDSFRRKGD